MTVSTHSPQALARRQQRLDMLAAAALRALAGDKTLAFRLRHAWRQGAALLWMAPHLRSEEGDGLATYRAIADGLAMRETSTEPAHDAHAPNEWQEPLARVLYEWFWQLRAESLAPEHWPGVRANLAAHFSRWTLAYHDSLLIDTELGLLVFSVVQMVWSGMNHRSPPDVVQDTMEATRAGMAPLLGGFFRELVRSRNDAPRFCAAAAALARAVAGKMTEAEEAAGQLPKGRRDPGNFFLWLDRDPPHEQTLPLAAAGDSRSWERQRRQYHVFTHEFDRELHPASLVRPALLAEYRRLLDQHLHALNLPVSRLGRALARRLAQPRRHGWHFEQESGRIDARHLPRVITSPEERHIFKREADPPQVDACLTVLIDISGSMKTHAETVALWADIWCRMAAVAQVPIEVLGFTTGAWNGGQARRAWLRAGQPPDPGRVAERMHYIYKSARESKAHSRNAIAALLKLDHYREGLDGEAVQWACQRQVQHGAARRVLLVFSDGCPMESATQGANDEFYLDNHLKEVVARETASGAQIIGVGLGLDLAPFYPVSVSLEPEEVLLAKSFFEVLAHIDVRVWPR